MQSNPLIIGVDVAKASLTVAHATEHSPVLTIANRAASIEAWLQSLPADCILGVESTGRYHELVVALACDRGLTVYLLNPRDLHYYARSRHRGAKTDPLDARLIARYLRHHHEELRPYRPACALEQELLRLQRGRARLVVLASSMDQMLKSLPELRSLADAAVQSLRQLQRHLDRHLRERLTSDPQRADLARRMTTIPGVGSQNSNHFATLLPRLQPANADALVAYVGHDPVPRDSGQRSGHRRLSKRGPALSRKLVYLAAWSAARHAPEWQALYRQQRARGRPHIQAVCILARRMLRTLYAVYRHGGTYDPARLTAAAGHAT